VSSKPAPFAVITVSSKPAPFAVINETLYSVSSCVGVKISCFTRPRKQYQNNITSLTLSTVHKTIMTLSDHRGKQIIGDTIQ
jgi:hypothetical protein